MHEIPADQWGAFIERLDGQLGDQMQELLAHLRFRAYGVASPHLSPLGVTGLDADERGASAVELGYGEPLSPTGPLVRVRTAATADPQEEPDLATVLADEADRTLDHAGLEEAMWPQAPRRRTAALAVDGVSRPADILGEGEVWAARTVLPAEPPLESREGVVITVLVRGLPLTDLQLRSEDDLSSFRLNWVVPLPGHMERPPLSIEDAETGPPPEGLDALAALVASCLADTQEATRAARADAPVPVTSVLSERQDQPWEPAIRAQMELAGQNLSDAEEAVTSMVNHLVRLSERAEWFQQTTHRQAAIDETIAYTAFGSDVPSREAQQAWQRWWHSQAGMGPSDILPSEVTREAIKTTMDWWHKAESEWLEAWRRWLTSRGK